MERLLFQLTFLLETMDPSQPRVRKIRSLEPGNTESRVLTFHAAGTRRTHTTTNIANSTTMASVYLIKPWLPSSESKSLPTSAFQETRMMAPREG